ncbi:MAG: glucokinase [Verrucomicrobia bacterium]|nr:glucokinase [Verrucomicrobiota bacterium]
MILAGDIGGTKTHLAFFKEEEKSKWTIDTKYKSSKYENLSHIVKEFLGANPGYQVERACFGIAGPIQEGKCRATNLPWVVDAKEIAKENGIKVVSLINDLEANAYGLTNLNGDEFFTLNEGKHHEGNQALISAGTGLGEAGLFWDGKKHLPFACEGGHCSFSPENELEIKLLRYLHKKYDHVSFERILSGPGVYNLYRFLIDEGIEREKESVKAAFETTDPSKVITEMGMKSACPACEKALDMFASIYGAEAANLALKMLAVGGVYIGGGIAPKILNELKEGGFMKRFIQKGRFTSLLLGIPVKVILNENTALLGAAHYAREHG